MTDDKIDFVPIALKAMGHRADIARAWTLIKYVLDAFKKVAPELVPLLKNLWAVFVPDARRTVAEYGTIVITVQVREVQRALGIKADGLYGDATAEAVRQFQIKHNLLPDGWAGRDTIIQLFK